MDVPQIQAAADAHTGWRVARPGSYIELVVSSSKTLIEKSRAENRSTLALAEVREFFPCCSQS